jgi:hypothetical protein
MTFFGLSVPPPPPSVPPLSEGASAALNTRRRLEGHKTNPNCISCHQIFDPFGLALESFDVMGRWRDQDGGEPVDPSGTFADGTAWTDAMQFKQRLMQYQDAFITNMTEVLLSYALGRTHHYGDGPGTPGRLLHVSEMPAVRFILRGAAGSNFTWSSIIAEIVMSQPFQMKNIVP